MPHHHHPSFTRLQFRPTPARAHARGTAAASLARVLTGLTGLAVAAACLGGCAGGPQAGGGDADSSPQSVLASDADPRTLTIVDGRTGEPVTWAAALGRAAAATAVVIGEQHDDAVGHAFQGAFVADLLQIAPETAVALEMLERDEQPLVSDWVEGIIDTDRFTDLTGSEAWAGDGSWAAWYQPVLDVARAAGAPIVAANAPRRYVRLARTQDFDALRALTPPRSDWFELPLDANAVDDGAYRSRFNEIMGLGPDDDASRLDATFRAQRVWDATMADSVASVVNRGIADRAVLLIGRFHSDFRGATVLELEARLDSPRVVTISLEPTAAPAVITPADDEARADIIVYTGR